MFDPTKGFEVGGMRYELIADTDMCVLKRADGKEVAAFAGIGYCNPEEVLRAAIDDRLNIPVTEPMVAS